MVQGQVSAGAAVLAVAPIAFEDVLPVQHHPVAVGDVYVAVQPDDAGQGVGFPHGAQAPAVALGHEFGLVQVHEHERFRYAANGDGAEVLIEDENLLTHRKQERLGVPVAVPSVEAGWRHVRTKRKQPPPGRSLGRRTRG